MINDAPCLRNSHRPAHFQLIEKPVLRLKAQMQDGSLDTLHRPERRPKEVECLDATVTVKSEGVERCLRSRVVKLRLLAKQKEI